MGKGAIVNTSGNHFLNNKLQLLVTITLEAHVWIQFDPIAAISLPTSASFA